MLAESILTIVPANHAQSLCGIAANPAGAGKESGKAASRPPMNP
jgi:hypothetical protein